MSIIDTRRDQMFPVLEPAVIERLRRFGEVRSYPAGAALVRVGDAGHGLTIILAGNVDITEHQDAGPGIPITTHGPGAFMGELAQLSGRPSLIDAHAQEPVEALVIPPDRLRAILIAEAEVGERIMRALILRRVGLIERGARRAGDCRRVRQRRRASARRLPVPQWSSASKVRSGDGSRGAGPDRAFPCRSRTIADRALSERPASA